VVTRTMVTMMVSLLGTSTMTLRTRTGINVGG